MTVTVLILANDGGFRRLMKWLLEERLKVMAVVEAGDGEDAVRLARALRPDVVLVDVATVRREGTGTIQRIKTERPETRVVILTSGDEEATPRALPQSGADALLDRETLVARLISTVAASKQVFRVAAPVLSRS